MVRHGATSEQLFASLPATDAAVRLSWPCAAGAATTKLAAITSVMARSEILTCLPMGAFGYDDIATALVRCTEFHDLHDSSSTRPAQMYVDGGSSAVCS